MLLFCSFQIHDFLPLGNKALYYLLVKVLITYDTHTHSTERNSL